MIVWALIILFEAFIFYVSLFIVVKTSKSVFNYLARQAIDIEEAREIYASQIDFVEKIKREGNELNSSQFDELRKKVKKAKWKALNLLRYDGYSHRYFVNAILQTLFILAVNFSLTYIILSKQLEGGFNGVSGPIGIIDAFYFSFVTMTTLGFGDISPSDPILKLIVVVQSVVGLFLIGFLVAFFHEIFKIYETRKVIKHSLHKNFLHLNSEISFYKDVFQKELHSIKTYRSFRYKLLVRKSDFHSLTKERPTLKKRKRSQKMQR